MYLTDTKAFCVILCSDFWLFPMYDLCRTSLSAEETSATISYNKCSQFDWNYIKPIILLKCISVKNLETIPLYSVGGHCKPKVTSKSPAPML